MRQFNLYLKDYLTIYLLLYSSASLLGFQSIDIVFSLVFVDPQQVEGNCCSDDQNTEVAENEIQDIELEAACPELSGQIIGGRPSSVVRHPYQVSMVMNGTSFCGGFIISRDYVLTAAHCVQK